MKKTNNQAFCLGCDSGAYELFLDGSGVGTKERWNKLKEWADK